MQTFEDAIITAHGIKLRPLIETDAPDVAEACSDELNQRWLPIPNPYTLDSARDFILGLAPKELDWGIGIHRAVDVDGRLMGVVGLNSTNWSAATTEVGYWLAPWARRKGIMYRAVCAITDWALDTQGIERVELKHATGNLASQRVAKRALFIREGLLGRAGRTHDGPVDLVLYSRLFNDPRPEISTEA